MKKVLLITFHASHNYGAILQAYALQQKILQMGANCETIDFRTKEEMAKNNVFRKTKAFNGNIKNILSAFYYLPLKNKYKKFENFINTKMRLTSKQYKNVEELSKENLKADVFLTGSDQVWNYDISNKETAYFLSFTNSGFKAAFSPSFGYATNLTDKTLIAKTTTYLNQYNLISVRDEAAADYVLKLTGKKPQITLDPTLLLPAADYDKIAAPQKYKFKYIFFYVVKNRKHFYDMAKKVSAFYKLPVIVSTLSSQYDFSKNFKRDFNSGPQEFISLIKNAEMVLTSSYHGTIFSILYKKPFFTFDGIKDARVSTLFAELGLQSRSLSMDNLQAQLPKVYDVDYNQVYDNLARSKQKSENYLKDVLAMRST
jgi:hypothetical protein